MRSETDLDDLGTVQAWHEVANRRILIVGLVALATGILATIFATLLLTDPPPRSAANESSIDQTIGITMGLSLAGLLGGALLLSKALRGGLTEHFEVREHGFIHSSGHHTHSWRWDQVRTIDAYHAPRSTSAARFLGNDHRCVVRFTDGSRVRFDGTTYFSQDLEATIRQHCPSARPQPHSEQRWRRFGLGWLLVGLALTTLAVGTFTYLTTLPDERVIEQNGWRTTVPVFTDGQIALITIALLACLVAGIVCISIYVTAKKTRAH